MATFSKYTAQPEHWESINMGVGIQPGTTASSTESVRIDALVKKASKDVFDIHKNNYNLWFQDKLRKDQLPYGHGALQPDGGIWFLDTKPVLVIEAKYQGPIGNAIERWFKNMYIARLINPEITYLTFASGLGVLEHNPIYEILYMPHKGKYNEIHVKENTAFLSTNGFTYDELKTIINDVFIATMKEITE